MAFVPNTQTEQFWHPVMGAVDLITGQVIESRRAKRQERLRQQMMTEQRMIDQERYGREVKGKQFQGMMDIYKTMLGDKDIEASEKTKLLKGMTDLVNAGPEATMAAPQAPQQMTRSLRPEYQKAMTGAMQDPTKQLPYDVADKIEKMVDDEVAKRNQNEYWQGMNRARMKGPANIQDKTLQQLLAMRRAYAPRMMKMSDEFGNESVEEFGGDPDVLAEIDARIAELQGFEPKTQAELPIADEPAPLDSKNPNTMSNTVMQAIGKLAEKGNPGAQKSMRIKAGTKDKIENFSMSGIAGPTQEGAPSGIDASMKALLDEMKQIREEAKKLK